MISPIAQHKTLDRFSSTRDGISYDHNQSEWSILSASRRCYFDFTKFKELTTFECIESIKTMLSFYLSQYSVAHTFNIFNQLVTFFKFSASQGALDKITPHSILAYRTSLDKRHEWHLGTLRAFLITWVKMGYPGIDRGVLTTLKQLTLHGNMKGEAVLIDDPEKGPFTLIEYNAIIACINDNFATNVIELCDFVLIWLYLAFGPRSVQLAQLKSIDFNIIQLENGSKEYLLNIPRAKQRGAPPRSEFKSRKLIPEIGQMIEGYVSTLGVLCAGLDLTNQEFPFFPNRENKDSCEQLKYHSTSEQLAHRLNKVFKTLVVKSERTGMQILASATRFRYTRATRAYAEGASELVIADLLDHSDTQNVTVYSKSEPAIIERIDKAMALRLAPIAQAFAGLAVADSATFQTDEHNYIISDVYHKTKVGHCGNHGFCNALAPIACYTCRSFCPWIDGPHDEILDSLIRTRARLIEQFGDLTIASVNDRTILACAEVVQKCDDLRKHKMENL